MSIAISVLFGDAIFYSSVSRLDDFCIGEQEDSELYIPGLGNELTVRPYGGAYMVEVANDQGKQQISVSCDKPTLIDLERKIAVFITENNGKYSSVSIPADCVVHVGKSDKPSPNGEKNEIVLDFPFVSRSHFVLTRENGNTRVSDVGSTNGLFLNGKKIQTAQMRDGDVLSIFAVRITLQGNQLIFENAGSHLKVFDIKETEKRRAAALGPVSEASYQVSRAPRLVSGVESETISIERPPQAGGTPQINWTSVLLTPIVSVGLMIVLSLLTGLNPIMLLMSAVMSVVSAIIAVKNYKKQKKEHRSTGDKIDEKYHAYLENVSKRLKEAHSRQLQGLLSANPSPEECFAIVRTKGRQLWERRPNDPDFLAVRLGMGTISAAVTASFQQAQVVIDENALETEAVEIAANSTAIEDAPILCSLIDGKQTGVVGGRQGELALVRNMIVELAAVHSYDELKIIVLAPEKEKEEWGWIRWLPHCWDGKRAKRYFFLSPDEMEEGLEEIEEMLSRRKNESNDFRGTDRMEMMPHYLFVAAAPSWIEKSPIRKYVFSDADLGCSSLFVYNTLSALPKECSQIIEINGGKGSFFNRINSSKKVSFQLDAFDRKDADKFARCMAPLNTQTEPASASIPMRVSFLEGYHVSRPEELHVYARWHQAKTYETLSVPIAVTAGGNTFDFDIHEKRHGVNGIVAGMPGSGKTEMVQSWLLSLAVNYSPQDVSFVLIDFKGTGMIAPFRNLPHLAGSISNLDTNVDRNLIAIQSEVRRREALIDKYSAKNIKNINDLNRGYKQGLVPEKLPILLIVIDEFAEFKKNFPDFGAEIDSLTSKGRALGIFVILMTQKPAGVISSKSEDNIKFRWCLRVANYGASREMIEKPDAAKISNPGRAFVKVGEDDVFEEVQSFWSGAPYNPLNASESASTPIARVEWNGRRIPWEHTAKQADTAAHEAEIDVVVRYIASLCRQHNIPEAEKVWTERLPERIELPGILTKHFDGKVWPESAKAAPVIGVVDDPAGQRQYPLALDFSKLGHTVVYGAPVTGKTTLLQTLAMSIALSRRPDEASVYIMDFGGWNMSVLRGIPHVGGIANDNEPERLKKLILLFSDILQERKERFSKLGVGNITAFRDSCKEPIPDVFLIVDNFGAMIKMYPDMDSFFISLTSSGANYGVYLVATATATNAVPMRISQNIKNALALQMIDKSYYTYTVGKVTRELPAVMGRGYAKGNPPQEFQAALPMQGREDKTVSDNIRKMAKLMQDAWNGNLPAMIPEMPETIPYGSIKTKDIALGLSTDKVQPVIFDHTKQHYLLISGIEQSGKSSMLQVVAGQLKQRIGGKLYVMNIKGDGLNELRGVSDEWLTNAADIDAFIEGLRPELQRRHAEKQSSAEEKFEPILLVIDDYTAFFKAVSNDTVQRLLAIVKLGKGLELYLLAAGDAYELTGYFNKGEALTLAIGKAKQTVMLGGCMNDHGAIPTKATYSQKSVPVREHEGIFALDSSYTVFRAMDIRRETE